MESKYDYVNKFHSWRLPVHVHLAVDSWFVDLFIHLGLIDDIVVFRYVILVLNQVQVNIYLHLFDICLNESDNFPKCVLPSSSPARFDPKIPLREEKH